MSATTTLSIEPYFDLEEFMNHSRENRIDNQALEKLLELWENWSKLLTAKKIENDGASWLAVWLPEEIETAVDEAWQTAPSLGYLLNALAQYLSMSAIQELIPQVAQGNCAPAPAPDLRFLQALDGAGLPCREDGTPRDRRYAVITHYPFKGGCEVCNLISRCPKGSGKEDFATVVLPGYERGVNG